MRVIGASNYTGERLTEAMELAEKSRAAGVPDAAAGVQPVRPAEV